MQQPRPFKIDLQISRRRQSTAYATARNTTYLDHSQMLKKDKMKKMITLTMTHRQPPELKPQTNPQNKHRQQCVNVSEFTLENVEPPGLQVRNEQQIANSNAHIGKQDLEMSQRQLNSSLRQRLNAQQGQQWWEYIKGKDQSDRETLLKRLNKTEKQLKFFRQMLNEKKQKFNLQKQHKIEKYQSYLFNLYKLYEQQLLSSQATHQAIEEINRRRLSEQQEDVYRRLRYNINQDGKKGLNFSPKSVSVFSGASETILISYEDSIRRGQNFSFGSSKKIEDRTFSASKDSASLFLNPGRACVSRRKLQFYEA